MLEDKCQNPAAVTPVSKLPFHLVDCRRPSFAIRRTNWVIHEVEIDQPSGTIEEFTNAVEMRQAIGGLIQGPVQFATAVA